METTSKKILCQWWCTSRCSWSGWNGRGCWSCECGRRLHYIGWWRYVMDTAPFDGWQLGMFGHASVMEQCMPCFVTSNVEMWWVNCSIWKEYNYYIMGYVCLHAYRSIRHCWSKSWKVVKERLGCGQVWGYLAFLTEKWRNWFKRTCGGQLEVKW